MGNSQVRPLNSNTQSTNPPTNPTNPPTEVTNPPIEATNPPIDDPKFTGQRIANFANGNKYNGSWKDGKFDGKGILIFSNGNSYVGDFEKGAANGWGQYFNANKELIYEGDWKDGEQHGKGTLIFPDGSSYVGNFEKGIQNGFGQHFNKNKKLIHKGNWKDGKLHGKGASIFSDGSSYVGDFREGIPNGSGRYFDKNKKLIRKGNWKDGKLNGRGQLIVENILRYDGDWKDNEMHGEGTQFCDGFVHKGKFENGRRHGFGKITYENGLSYEGHWSGDHYEGEVVFRNEKGDVYVGEYDGFDLIPYNKQRQKPAGYKFVIINPLPLGADPALLTERKIKIIQEALGENSKAHVITPATDEVLPIADYVTSRKNPKEGRQIIIRISTHGIKNGDFAHQDFILRKLNDILEQTELYNSQLAADEEKVQRFKIVTNSCYGDKCIANPELEKFYRSAVSKGFEIRTSAILGDSISSGAMTNGKNNLAIDRHDDEFHTLIVERLYNSSASQAIWDKKYRQLQLQDLGGGLQCHSGIKSYRTIDDFLSDDYASPSNAPQPSSSARADEANMISIINDAFDIFINIDKDVGSYKFSKYEDFPTYIFSQENGDSVMFVYDPPDKNGPEKKSICYKNHSILLSGSDFNFITSHENSIFWSISVSDLLTPRQKRDKAKALLEDIAKELQCEKEIKDLFEENSRGESRC